MRLTRLLSIAAAASLGLAAGASAQNNTFFTVSPGVSFASHQSNLPSSFLILGRDSDREVQNGELTGTVGFGSAIGARVKNKYAFDIAVSWVSSSITSTNNTTKIGLDVFTFSGSASYVVPITPKGPELYAGVGGGVKLYDWLVDSSKAETDLSWNVGGGVNVPIQTRLALRVDGRDHMSIFGSRMSGVDGVLQHDLILTVGVTFSTRDSGTSASR